MKAYNDYSNYIKRVFGQRVQKISINAGFTCPNRDGNKGIGGCSFCNNSTFNPDYCDPHKSILEQIDIGINFFRPKYQTQFYIAYFQAYSNTYGQTEDIIEKYKTALSHPLIKGLIIGTRPDCLEESLIKQLAEINRQYYVAIELGAESCNNQTLVRINRGHTWEDTVYAVERLKKHNIPVGLHMIMGLPGETKEQMLDQADILSELPIDFVKLHQLQIVKGSAFASEYAANPLEFNLWQPTDYADFCIKFTERLDPRIIIERFVSQAPRDMVIAPSWDIKNFEFTHIVDRMFAERQTWQGKAKGHNQDEIPE